MPIIALITIPENRARAAGGYRRRHADYVARAHACGECGGERLRLRYRAFAGFPALFAEYTAERRFHPCADVRYLENPDRTLSRSPVPVKATSSGTPQITEFIEETRE